MSEVIGSWKIMAMSSPRTRRIRRSASVGEIGAVEAGSMPPAMRAAGFGSRPMIDSAVTDLPEPGFAGDAERLAARAASKRQVLDDDARPFAVLARR